MSAGSVATLVVLGTPPDAVGSRFQDRRKKVKTTIALSTHADETAKLASWSIPSAHFLESWDDARAVDGTLSVVQPLILPLFGGKGATELLGLLATGTEPSGHDHVRETWKPILGEADFERRWNRVLHDGLLAGSATPAVAASPVEGALPTEAEGGIEPFPPLALPARRSVRDDGWL
jgi:molybdopterin-containing oxidoreductase family iron-sulfur binding subunit